MRGGHTAQRSSEGSEIFSLRKSAGQALVFLKFGVKYLKGVDLYGFRLIE